MDTALGGLLGSGPVMGDTTDERISAAPPEGLSPERADLYALREATERLLLVLNRHYPRYAALPYEIRLAVQRAMEALAAPWYHLLHDLRAGDVVLVHLPPGEDPQVLQETYARIAGSVPKGVVVLTETSGVYLEHVPAPVQGDVILIRVRQRQQPDDLIALGQMTRAVFGGTPTVVVQDESHDILRFNEHEMRKLGWRRADDGR